LKKAESSKKDNSYTSKVFYVRYSDEVVNLGEIICFKSEVEAEVSKEEFEEDTEYFLEIGLHFLEATEVEIANASKVRKSIGDEEIARFKHVQTKKYGLRFNDSKSYLHSQPVVFDPYFVSNLSLIVQ